MAGCIRNFSQTFGRKLQQDLEQVTERILAVLHSWGPLTGHDDEFTNVDGTWEKIPLIEPNCKERKRSFSIIFYVEALNKFDRS